VLLTEGLLALILMTKFYDVLSFVDVHAIGRRRNFLWSVGIRREGRFPADRSHGPCLAG